MNHVESGTYVAKNGEQLILLENTLENGGVLYQKGGKAPYALTTIVGGSGDPEGCQYIVDFKDPRTGRSGEFEYICVPSRKIRMIIFSGKFFFPQVLSQ